MMLQLMEAHAEMHGFVRKVWPEVYFKSSGSRRAVYLSMLLLAKPEQLKKSEDLLVNDSYATIAELAGVSEQTIINAVHDLLDAGLIEKREPSRGRGHPAVFALVWNLHRNEVAS